MELSFSGTVVLLYALLNLFALLGISVKAAVDELAVRREQRLSREGRRGQSMVGLTQKTVGVAGVAANTLSDGDLTNDPLNLTSKTSNNMGTPMTPTGQDHIYDTENIVRVDDLSKTYNFDRSQIVADPILDDPDQSFIVKWAYRTWLQRAVVLPFIMHVMDTATDFGVLFQWFNESAKQRKENGKVLTDRNEISILTLALFSLLAMVLYRLLSSLTVYNIYSRSPKRTQIMEAMLQMLDIKILKEIFDFQSDTTTIDSIRWLHKIEALLEAGPQSLLQMVYILRPEFDRSSSGGVLVIMSLFFSMCTLASRLVFDDKYLFSDAANQVYPPSKLLFIRSMFRLSEIVGRLLCLAYIWCVFSGYVLWLYWMVQVMVLSYMFTHGLLGYEVWNIFGYFLAVPDLGIKQREEIDSLSWQSCCEWSCLTRTAAVGLGCFCPAFLCLTNNCCVSEPWNISYFFISGNCIQNCFWLCLIGLFSSTSKGSTLDDLCSYLCPKLSVRRDYVWDGDTVAYYILAWLCTLMTPVMYTYITSNRNMDDNQQKMFDSEKTVARSGNPKDLINLERYDDLKRALAGDSNTKEKPTISLHLDRTVVINAAVHAAIKGDRRALHVFGELFYNFNCTDQYGRTPLHYAAMEGRTECITLIHSYKANPNALDSVAKSPAHYAAERGHTESLRALGNCEANLDVYDQDGKSLAELAFDNGQTGVIEVLTEFGVKWDIPMAGTQISNFNTRTMSEVAEVVGGSDTIAELEAGLQSNQTLTWTTTPQMGPQTRQISDSAPNMSLMDSSYNGRTGLAMIPTVSTSPSIPEEQTVTGDVTMGQFETRQYGSSTDQLVGSPSSSPRGTERRISGLI